MFFPFKFLSSALVVLLMLNDHQSSAERRSCDFENSYDVNGNRSSKAVFQNAPRVPMYANIRLQNVLKCLYHKLYAVCIKKRTMFCLLGLHSKSTRFPYGIMISPVDREY